MDSHKNQLDFRIVIPSWNISNRGEMDSHRSQLDYCTVIPSWNIGSRGEMDSHRNQLDFNSLKMYERYISNKKIMYVLPIWISKNEV